MKNSEKLVKLISSFIETKLYSLVFDCPNKELKAKINKKDKREVSFRKFIFFYIIFKINNTNYN